MKPIITILIFTLLGCTEYQGTYYPPAPVVETPPQFSISPTFCLIGDVVTISDTGFGTSGKYLTVRFFGGVEVRADSGNDTIAYATVPFGAFSGFVTVTGKSYSDSLPITIYEAYNPYLLDTRWYNLPHPITPENVTIVPFWDDTVHWNDWLVTVSHDTIVFFVRFFDFPDDFSQYTFRLQDNGPSVLPSLLDAEYASKFGPDTLHCGLLKIQDWDTSAVVSGRFYTPRSTGIDRIGFWYDFSAPNH